MTAMAVVATASGATADTADNIESAWSKLKGPLLDAATEVCSLSKNHQWRPHPWWGNEQVDEAIQEKCAQFKAYNALKKGARRLRPRKHKLCMVTPSL